MKVLLKTSIIVCVFLTLNSTSKAQNPEDVTNDWKATVENILPNFLNASANQFEGLAISFVYGDSSWTTSIGQANDTGLAVDPDGKWLFRSYTKLMVSVIILQLYEEGQLDLTDTISEHLDPITNVNMSDTIDDLLQMRSRMCAYINSTDSVLDKIDEDRSAVLDTRTMLEEHLPAGPCNEEKAYDYNDANFQVLGLIIEAVTGKSGEEVFNERIIEPYSLDSTALAPLDLERNQFNGLYRSVKDDEEEITTTDDSMESLNSLLTSQKFNGGIMGSTSDMINFTKALMDGTVIEDATLDLMKADPDTVGYGKGLMIQEMKGELGGFTFDFDSLYPGKYYGHGGTAWNTSRTFYDPERKIGFSFAFNSSTPSFDAVFNTEKFKENMYRLMRICIDDGGCSEAENEPEMPGVLHEKNFTHENETREYSIYQPKGFNPDQEWPLVLNFHGYSGDIEDQIDRVTMHDIADSLGFIIAYPQGLTINRYSGILPGFVPESGTGWNVPGFSNDSWNELDFVDSLLTQIKQEFPIDETRIHTTGISLGGYMALYVATQKPDQIASFASVIGHMTFEVQELIEEDTQLSALLMHGTNDPITYYNGLDNYYLSVPATAGFFATRNNCSSDSTIVEVPDTIQSDNSTITRIQYSDCDENLNVQLYRVNEGGHRWPGSGRTDLIDILGNNNEDIIASQEILQFFEANPLVITSIEEENNVNPVEFSLSQNYPNPFNPSTNISFELPQAGLVQLKVFNLLGQEVANLVDRRMNSGIYTVNFDASHLSSGVYIYRLSTGTTAITKKMILIK